MNFVALTTCTVDYFPQIDQSFMGGNTLNLASQWRKMDANANISVITCLGKDKNGETIYNFFKQIGINTKRVYIKEGSTACNQLRVDESGERFGIEGTWQGGLYETFLLSEQDWDFVLQQDLVAIPANNPNFNEYIKRKNNSQFFVVDYLDIENEVPIEDSLNKTDVALITAKPELLEYYKDLAFRKNKLLIVTLGAKGSYAFYNKETYHQPAIKVPKVIDTTGCGDSYLAAFAYSYYKNRNIKEAMLAGAEAAAEILQYYGGVGKI